MNKICTLKYRAAGLGRKVLSTGALQEHGGSFKEPFQLFLTTYFAGSGGASVPTLPGVGADV